MVSGWQACCPRAVTCSLTETAADGGRVEVQQVGRVLAVAAVVGHVVAAKRGRRLNRRIRVELRIHRTVGLAAQHQSTWMDIAQRVRYAWTTPFASTYWPSNCSRVAARSADDIPRAAAGIRLRCRFPG